MRPNWTWQYTHRSTALAPLTRMTNLSTVSRVALSSSPLPLTHCSLFSSRFNALQLLSQQLSEGSSLRREMPLLLLLLLPSLLLLSPPQVLSLNQDGLYLLQAKRGLSDPSGALSSWNPRDSTPCNWTGIKCDSSSGRVYSISLAGSQLAGPFPIILCRLPYLSTLSLFDNNINASLPSDVSTCQKLTELNLSQNLLGGSVPGSLSKLPNLRHLDLSYNSFTGE